MSGNGPTRARVHGTEPSDTLSLIEPKSLRGIVAAASDITLVLDGSAVIKSLMVNEASADFGNLDHWIGRSMREFLTTESLPKFDAAFDRFARGEYPSRAVELNHRDNAVWEFPILYTLHPIGAENRVLLMGKDLRPISETQRQLVQAQIALERGYEAQREFEARYRLLLASVTDAIVLVTLGDGRIADVNDRAALVLGGARKELVGSVLASHFSDIRRGEMETRLLASSAAEASETVDLTTARSGQKVRLVPRVFRVGGDRVAICRVEETVPVPASDGQGFGATLEAFFAAAMEPILFTDAFGMILSANDRFLALVDAPRLTDVKGRHLNEFLARGQVDLGVLMDNVRRSGHVRLFATEVVSDYGTRTPVELSAVLVRDRKEPMTAFVFRDAARAEAVRLPSADGDGTAQQNIMALVGSAPLKEIVAETNDMIEKICIETALRLTSNNRVAAAEMLGLSRQSLYVKLRKFKLLKRGDDEE